MISPSRRRGRRAGPGMGRAGRDAPCPRLFVYGVLLSLEEVHTLSLGGFPVGSSLPQTPGFEIGVLDRWSPL